MKKSQLIEMLNNIEGDPDIFFFNGFVNDYMDLDTRLVETRHVKQTFKNWVQCTENEMRLRNNDMSLKLPEAQFKKMKNLHRYYKWQENIYVTNEDIQNKKYRAKTVYYLQAEARGKTDVSHTMSLSY